MSPAGVNVPGANWGVPIIGDGGGGRPGGWGPMYIGPGWGGWCGA